MTTPIDRAVLYTSSAADEIFLCC